ncbi:hypothetical protein JCGZ_12653 [Jatropha curcas]|uniref:Uncharacterized protein n=1 Tax=Jatropha curcas TaxID=180498 RepID=A0A067KPU4_JATCU|nr:hypothetical protein JCGZ_12653 [Jatropha curcas]
MRESGELNATLEEDLKVEQAKMNADLATCAVNDMLLRQSDLIMTKLYSQFPKGDWGFVGEVDVHKGLEIEDEVATGGDAMNVEVQDLMEDVLPMDALSALGIPRTAISSDSGTIEAALALPSRVIGDPLVVE